MGCWFSKLLFISWGGVVGCFGFCSYVIIWRVILTSGWDCWQKCDWQFVLWVVFALICAGLLLAYFESFDGSYNLFGDGVSLDASFFTHFWRFFCGFGIRVVLLWATLSFWKNVRGLASVYVATTTNFFDVEFLFGAVVAMVWFEISIFFLFVKKLGFYTSKLRLGSV